MAGWSPINSDMENTIASHFAAYLEARRKQITEQWIDAVLESPEILGTNGMTRQELADHLPLLFDDLVEYLRTEAGGTARRRTEKAAFAHGRKRWRQNFELTDLIRELWTIHRITFREVIQTFIGEHPQLAPETANAQDLISLFFEDSAVSSVNEYVGESKHQSLVSAQSLAEANELLRKIDASRLLFVRTVSHDLGNLLNSLSWLVAISGAEPEESERQRIISVCQRNLNDMGALLHDLTDYSALLAGEVRLEPEKFSLDEFCADLRISLRPVAQANGLTLEVSVGPGIREVVTDRTRLNQILQNLVTNAIKYRNRDLPEGRVSVRFDATDEGHWCCEVADTGVGIGKEQLDLIFEEFQRLAPPELGEEIHVRGLGLAITKRLVQVLEGEITVESQVGVGTRFVIRLPTQPNSVGDANPEHE
jgi:signal transduction histidine kinase